MAQSFLIVIRHVGPSYFSPHLSGQFSLLPRRRTLTHRTRRRKWRVLPNGSTRWSSLRPQKPQEASKYLTSFGPSHLLAAVVVPCVAHVWTVCIKFATICNNHNSVRKHWNKNSQPQQSLHFKLCWTQPR